MRFGEEELGFEGGTDSIGDEDAEGDAMKIQEKEVENLNRSRRTTQSISPEKKIRKEQKKMTGSKKP